MYPGPVNDFIYPDTVLKEIHKTAWQNVSEQYKVFWLNSIIQQ